MKNPATTNLLLLVIAIALIAIALRPLRQPRPAQAQDLAPFPVYIEPGTQMLRSPDGSQNVYGKMVVDLQTGKRLGISYDYGGAVSRRHFQGQAARLPPVPAGHVRLR